MTPAMLMFLFGVRPKVLQTVTVNANTTWICPADVPKLESVVGHGAAGTPSIPGEEYYEYTVTDTTTYDAPQYGADSTTSSGPTRVYSSDSIGASHCDPAVYNASLHRTTQRCYTITYGDTGTTPAKTGASATAFGKTFPGGTGGPATTISYPNPSSPNPIVVTSGTSYPIVAPPGTTVQFTFYQ